jgi:hypothetical protein
MLVQTARALQKNLNVTDNRTMTTTHRIYTSIWIIVCLFGAGMWVAGEAHAEECVGHVCWHEATPAEQEEIDSELTTVEAETPMTEAESEEVEQEELEAPVNVPAVPAARPVSPTKAPVRQITKKRPHKHHRKARHVHMVFPA